MFDFLARDPLKSFSSELKAVNNTLFSNLYCDLMYENYPTMPTGRVSRTHTYGAYQVRMTTVARDPLQIFQVFHDGKDLGSLYADRHARFSARYPEGTHPREACDTLVRSLILIADLDQKSRETPSACAQTSLPSSPSNVVRFPDGQPL